MLIPFYISLQLSCISTQVHLSGKTITGKFSGFYPLPTISSILPLVVICINISLDSKIDNMQTKKLKKIVMGKLEEPFLDMKIINE